MRRALVTLFVLGLAVSASSSSFGAQEKEGIARLYPLQHLDAARAMYEVQAAYPDAITRVEISPQMAIDAAYLRVVGSAADQEAIARILAEKDVAPPSVTMQVILLEAVDVPVAAPELPGGAQNALKDVRTLFPFKGYRVCHTAVIPAGRSAMASLGGEFGVRLDARPQSAGNVEVPGFELVKTAKEGTTQILGTSFSIKRGETVVLGTSLVPATAKVDPDVPRALVVLVTALP